MGTAKRPPATEPVDVRTPIARVRYHL